MSGLPEDIMIREFKANDAAMVREFFAQMGEESTNFFNGGHWNERRALRFFEPGGAPDTVYFAAVERGPSVAEQGGLCGGERMAGYLFLWDMHKSVPWLGIAVRDEYKGMGLGTRLMRHAREYARALGKGGILLTTAQRNFRGQALYEKSGYERIGVAENGELLYILREL